jgi:phosphonopyruvate decarboxylase
MLAVAGRKANHFHSLDAMGQTLPLGLGLALGLAEQSAFGKVVVVEGEGSMLMGFSALPTVGHLKPENLLTVVLDNGVYLATGGQPSAVQDVDLCGAALACGWVAARDVVSTSEEVEAALNWAREARGPVLLRVPVSVNQPRTEFFLEDPVVIGHTFIAWLRGRR